MGKARTRGQKKRAGRPLIPNKPRTPEGRISRTKDQNEQRAENIMGVVIEMRGRLHGASGENARRPEWGYVLGRIYLDGNLGPLTNGGDTKGRAELRLEAGNRYAQDMARYYGLTGVQFPSARAQSLFTVRGTSDEVTDSVAAAARKASDNMMMLEGKLLSLAHGRQVATTVKNVCLMDIDEARGWPKHMHEYLRSGLDALVWVYGLQAEGEWR